MNKQRKLAVILVTVIMTLSILIVPFTPTIQVAQQVATPQVSTPEDVQMDLEKYLDERELDGPLDSILTAYKETGIVPASVVTNEEGAMGVLITIKNTADTAGIDDVVDVNWKVDFGVATIASAFVGSVDEILAIENYDGVVTAFADSLFKEKTEGVEPRPVNDVAPIYSEPTAYATTIEIGADQVVLDGVDGTGVRVGVIDSGTDFSSPDLVDAIDFGSDGLPTSYDPTGYGFGMSLYRVNLTTVDPSSWMAYSSWNILSYTEGGKTYIDTTSYQHNGGSPYINNNGGLSDLDWFIDAYLDAWWGNEYPNQDNLTDFYYEMMRQPLEIPYPSTIDGGIQLNITINQTTGEWAMVPYACHGYVFQQRFDPYTKIFSPVLVVNNTKIIVDWNTTRAWTDFWNLNINHGVYDFNDPGAWDYYDALGDWSFTDDLTAGKYYTPDGTVAHTNMYHDYPDSVRFGLGTLAHVWDGSIFGLGMIDGIALGGRAIGIMYDGDSHGTFVAGQIASRGVTQYPVGLNGSLEYLPGVAPDSTIMGVMTVGITSEFNSMLWAAGFDFNYGTGYWEWNPASDHQMDITSNSWGWATPQYYELWGPYSLIYAAMATPGFFDPLYPGMIQCFSAGNSGPGYGTTTPPRAPQIINVGATTSYHTFENSYGPDQGFDQIADFSSRGPLTLGYSKPDVLAPGRNNWGIVPSYGSVFGLPASSLGYEVYSGTSMACPMVAGVAALLIDAYRANNGNANMTPDYYKTLMQSTADDIGMDALSQGHGVVNAWAAYDYIVNGNGNVFFTYDSTENWAAATADAWDYHMNPYDMDNYIEAASPPTNFADGNLYFGLVEGGDAVTMTVEIDGDYGDFTDWNWNAVEYVQDTVTTFPFQTFIYNETTSSGSDTTRAGWFELDAELGGNYANFAASTYATIYITGDQMIFGDDSLWSFVFDWDDSNVTNGIPDYYNMTTGMGDELTRLQFAGGTGNVLKMDLSHPDGLATLFPNEGIVMVHDDNIWSWPYMGGFTLDVTVVTWQLVDNANFVFADNAGDCDITLDVPAMEPYGIHQGFINASGSGGVYMLPYTYNVYATYDTEGSVLTVADGVSDSSNPYEPGVISAGWDSYYAERSADHHSFVVDMTDATVNYVAVRLEWTNDETDMDIALVSMVGIELANSADSIKTTLTSALLIYEIQAPGMFILYTTVNAMDGSTIPEDYTLTFMGLETLDEPTLTLSWYSRDSPSPTVFTSGDTIAGDHVVINATWTDVDIPELPELKIASIEMKVLYGVLFYEEGSTVVATDPGGVFSGIIDPSQFAWVTVPNLVAGDIARIVCDFDGSDVDIMMWPSSIPMSARTYANNIVDMASGDHPETDTIVIPESGDYAIGVLDYAGDSPYYYLTVDTRLGLEPDRILGNTIELDTYYLQANSTYTILVDSDTGSNQRYSVEVPNVFIGNFFAPEVTVFAPTPVVGDETRTFDFTWSSTDRNADDVNYYSLWLSNNDGASYMLLAQNLTVTTYRWNSSGWLPDMYMIRVRAYSVDFTSGLVDVSNPPAGYWPGDFADGFSLPFAAGDYTVTDTTDPTINHPSDVLYDDVNPAPTIIWTPYDVNPSTYAIYLEDVLVRSGAWNSSSEVITLSLDGLPLGVYYYTIVVTDLSSNSVHDNVTVTVFDGTFPIIDSPVNIDYVVGTIGHSITWSPDDIHPATYLIYRDTTLVKSGFWNSTSETITISVDGLVEGTYNYIIIVSDTSGNIATDTVVVSVVSESTSTTTPTDTSTTDTSTTDSNTTTTTPLEGLSPTMIIIIGIGAAGVVIVIIIIILRKRT